MEIDTEASNSQFTILRIKRKRTEEPLDALVVESRVRRKKSRGVGVFQFAKTVEDGVWKDEESAKDIQEQVSRLARESSLPTIREQRPIPASMMRQKDDSRRYMILKKDDTDTDPQQRRFPTHPPKVLSSKDLPPKALNSDIKMFDAVLETSQSAPTTIDPEMDKFLPMLQDYLRIHDIDPRGSSKKPIAPNEGVAQSDDYVWDVFYHRPLTLSEWNEAANIGTVSGLPPALTNAYDSASESEEEDEADEDSNAEEYYKNDYPDEEDDSDELHDGSELDGAEGYDESDDDW